MKFFKAQKNQRGQASIEAVLWCTTLLMIAVFGKEIFYKYYFETNAIQEMTEQKLFHKVLNARAKQ